MPTPPDIIYSYAECTKDNLAPRSSDAVWECVSELIDNIHNLKADFVAGKWHGDPTRLVFRSNATSNNLITIWPKQMKEELDIDVRASGPASLNRINKRKFSPDEFNESFETICNGISERFRYP